MDELDVLKKDWKKQMADLPSLSNTEIEGMLLKKSSSIVKWIFVVSLLEFTLPHLMLLVPGAGQSMEFYSGMPVHGVLIGMTVIYYIGVAYFIRKFYLRYKEISVLDNVRRLLKKIVATRHTVRNYVIFSLSMTFLFICMVILGIYLGDSLPPMPSNEDILAKYPLETAKAILMISTGITGVLIIGFMGLVYFLLYGLLLRKLFRNYNDLKQVEF